MTPNRKESAMPSARDIDYSAVRDAFRYVTPTGLNYTADESWQGGWQITCRQGPDPMYVLEHAASEDEARARATYLNTLCGNIAAALQDA